VEKRARLRMPTLRRPWKKLFPLAKIRKSSSLKRMVS
jgi:hypothetical protein